MVVPATFIAKRMLEDRRECPLRAKAMRVENVVVLERPPDHTRASKLPVSRMIHPTGTASPDSGVKGFAIPG